MKNFNKKFVVAIMLLVILFANNLSVQAATDEEILNSISESFTLINQERRYVNRRKR